MTLRSAFLMVSLLTVLAACGSSQTPEQRAQAAENRAKNDAIWATRQVTQVNGLAYEVAISPDRSYALVAPSEGKVWVMSEMLTAVNRVSGCTGAPDFLMASLVGGNLSQPIDRSTVRTNVDRMRSELSC